MIKDDLTKKMVSTIFARHRTDKIAKSTVEDELRRVAEYYRYHRFTCSEFDQVATKCKASTVLRSFGNNWRKALALIKPPLKSRQYTRQQISDEDFFNEMDRILGIVGQRPSKDEWENAEPRYSYGGIYKRFGGWLAAWEEFVEHKSDHVKLTASYKNELEPMKPTARHQSSSIRSRNVPLKLRLDVLKRDYFKCVLCGKSPAKNPGEATLHIDHVLPFSRGGESVIGNLQTLCEKCNLGKGDSTESL